MRHGKKVNHLSRKSAHRKALMTNLASELIMHKRITTTLPKAKALRKYVEPLITRSKEDTTHSRRIAFRYLRRKEAAKELFDVVAKKVGDRPGGYLRIIKLGNRFGDAAEMAMIELVDFNEIYSANESKGKSTRRRRRRGGGGSSDSAKPSAAAPATEEKVEEATEAPAAEEVKEEAPAQEEVKEEAPAEEEVNEAAPAEEVKEEAPAEEATEEAPAEEEVKEEAPAEEAKEEAPAEETKEEDAPAEEESKDDSEEEEKKEDK